MTDAECAEILSEFRKLSLGPELSAALDHAITQLSMLSLRWAHIDPAHPAYPMPKIISRSGGAIAGGAADEVLMNGVAA